MQRKRESTEEIFLRNFLKEHRLIKKYSQRQLSLLIDGSHSFVNKYELGERFLTFTEVILICKLLDADVHRLLEEINNL